MRPEAADQSFAVRVRAGPRACLALELRNCEVRNLPFQFREVEALWTVDDSTGALTLHAFRTLWRIRQEFQSPLVRRQRRGDFDSPQGRTAGSIAGSVYRESLGVLGDAAIRGLRILEGAATRITESESRQLATRITVGTGYPIHRSLR